MLRMMKYPDSLPSSDRFRRCERGFTLMELVAVLVIVAVLAAVAVPSLDAIDETRAAMAAKQLLRDLTFARLRFCSAKDAIIAKIGLGVWFPAYPPFAVFRFVDRQSLDSRRRLVVISCGVDG